MRNLAAKGAGIHDQVVDRRLLPLPELRRTMRADAKTQSPMRHVVRRDGGVVKLRPSDVRALLFNIYLGRMLVSE